MNEVKAVALGIAAIDDRLNRLTDAYIDKAIEKELYLQRKAALLDERTSLTSRKASLEGGRAGADAASRERPRTGKNVGNAWHFEK